MGYLLITGPELEPVSLTDAKIHLKIEADDTSEDFLIETLIAAARENAEMYTRRAFVPQTWEYQDDCFDTCEIQLHKTPVTSITSIKYFDINGVEQTLPTTVYGLNLADEPNEVYLKYGQLWPVVRGEENDVKIRFVAGYDTVPASVRAAILLIVGHLYENREDVIIGRQVNELPKGSKYLLDPYRLFSF